MNKLKLYMFVLHFLLFPSLIFSENITDTVAVFSKSMDKAIKNLVILPDNYNVQPAKHYPVVYLLHGYGANYATWLNVVKKNLPELASQYQFIIVCPDGAKSWYWDSPLDSTSRYDTYISKELISYIDSHYRTIPQLENRAITGFSMGGHGALWFTMQHTDLFGACGSMSGGVDIRPFPKNWEIYRLIGSYENNQSLWNEYTVFTHVDKFKNRHKALIIDCGASDFFLPVNEKFHQELVKQDIPHKYLVSEGDHKPSYWRKAIDVQLKFFSDYFNRVNSLK